MTVLPNISVKLQIGSKYRNIKIGDIYLIMYKGN